MQFVKIGPCELYRKAQEQLKKVEEVKSVRQEIKDDAEDWQAVRLLFILMCRRIRYYRKLSLFRILTTGRAAEERDKNT